MQNVFRLRGCSCTGSYVFRAAPGSHRVSASSSLLLRHQLQAAFGAAGWFLSASNLEFVEIPGYLLLLQRLLLSV